MVALVWLSKDLLYLIYVAYPSNDNKSEIPEMRSPQINILIENFPSHPQGVVTRWPRTALGKRMATDFFNSHPLERSRNIKRHLKNGLPLAMHQLYS